jgi:hypothetical protein
MYCHIQFGDVLKAVILDRTSINKNERHFVILFIGLLFNKSSPIGSDIQHDYQPWEKAHSFYYLDSNSDDLLIEIK